MRKFVFVFLTVFLLVITSCINDANDCPCTMEFRMVTVVVVDSVNNPVKGLLTNVKDQFGKEYDFSNEDPFFEGHYIVMSDNYVHDFSVVPKAVIFNGRKDNLEVNAAFMISADRCNCHIDKVSGPDTLMLK